ncbi:glycoside hydrolase family protein (plasmid) [Azospirillum sp. A26]|uniref:glycoside hydrolase family protein n=1 Tax=Azospirillum sp. A26 TaxID=3160607 RepID=UPI00366B64AC
MTKPVTQAAVDLVKHFEGLYLKAYLCPAGVPTVAWGHTGPDVVMGMTVTLAQAEQLLAADLAEAAADVDRYVKVPLTDDQRGALASFVFNLGAGSLASSTLLKLLNVGDAGAAEQFGRWVNATVNGKLTKLPGLVARRAAEQALFEGRPWGVEVGVDTPHPMPQAITAPAGSDADRIKAIQRIVGVTPDGHYGPLTKAAVTRWQAAHFLVADGIVGPKTAAAMGL